MSDIDSDDDEEFVDVMETEEVSPLPEPAVKELNNIWEDDKVEKYTDENDKKRWKCHWCGTIFLHWNATKALYHVAKAEHGDVRKCQSRAIDSAHRNAYQGLLKKHLQQKKSHQTLTQSKKRSSDEYIASAADAYNSTRRRKSSPGLPTTTPSPANMSANQDSTTPRDSAQTTPTNNPTSNSTGLHQRTIIDMMDTHAEGKLTMAIADLIHSCGLPFSLASHHKFKRVLSLAKFASQKYVPPGRNKVGGELLDLNYQLHKDRILEDLQKEADVYGLSFFGDGATVKKSPLMNVLASSVHLPVGCLRIVDCTGHLESDGRKDAAYIADLFLPHITQMEEKVPKCTDLVIFDGASNVQKAGSLLEARFPHISVIHGAEHVISLFYHDVFSLREFEMLKRMNRLIYKYFGNGSHHSPFALFSKHSRDHNGGKSIGLIRAADTRMAGHVISMLRTLRLKDALISTISSASFIQGKFKVSTR